MVKREAIFGAGCFWGVQFYFDQVPGVLETEVGYIGGNVDNPTYELVCTHTTGHSEAVRIIYDATKIDYPTLLKHFFRMHDPTQLNRQGPDIGDSYRSAIFYLDDKQKLQARQAIEKLNKNEKYTKPIVTTIEQATPFWPAESYHQKFTERTGRGMCHVAYKPI